MKKKDRETLFSRWKGLPLLKSEEISKLDIIVTIAVLAFLYIAFVHGDIRVTGNRSLLLYKHPFDFYKASFEQSGNFYANYMPSTFIAFAVWNLPLYLLKGAPADNTVNSFVSNMWYKLLPVLLYFITAHVIYKIALLLGFGEKKARLCKYAFIIFPIGVYSQFIFSQYDIFTVFFVVVGLYFYFKGEKWDMLKFALAFGMAATFKYQALAYFLILLVLKEKKIRNIIKYAVPALAPLAAEVLPNWSSPYFHRSVLGFGALDFVDNGFDVGFISGINLMMAMAAFLLVWAYQRKTTAPGELQSWALFLTTGMSFTLFGLANWNPQWLLLIVPFLLLSIFRNKNGNLFVMITNILMAAMYIFMSHSLVGAGVLTGGIFKYLIKGRQFATSMWDIYGFHDETLLATAIWVVLLAYFVFNHPRFHTNQRTEVSRGLLNQLRAAFAVGVLAFAVPAFLCLASVVRGEVIFKDNSSTELAECVEVDVSEDSSVRQLFYADGNTLTDIQMKMCLHYRINDSYMNVVVRSHENGTVVYEGQVDTLPFTSEDALYSVIEGPVEVEKGQLYELELTSPAVEIGCISGYYKEAGEDETEVALDENGNPTDQQLIMKIRGIDK